MNVATDRLRDLLIEFFELELTVSGEDTAEKYIRQVGARGNLISRSRATTEKSRSPRARLISSACSNRVVRRST